MVEPFLISKALDITPTALGKSTFATLKGLLVIGAIAGLGWAIYAGLIRPITKPNPSTTQQGQRDNFSYTIAPRQTFGGCMRFDLKKPNDVAIPIGETPKGETAEASVMQSS